MKWLAAFIEAMTARLNGHDGWAPRLNPMIAQNHCCLLAANLYMIERKPHVRVYRCQKCLRRHYRALVNEHTFFGEAGKVDIK